MSTILNVAEKPSIAKSISKVLSSSIIIARGKHKYCPNIFFSYNSKMIFTSVLGHLFSQNFRDNSNWALSDPFTLFSDDINRFINPEMTPIAENIINLSRDCSHLIIWTDCDREGEHIAREIQSLITTPIIIKRARFCGITKDDIEKALNDLDVINENEADAVETRIELDLRIGSAFTRIQTLSCSETTQDKNKKNVLSFGPCQIPTLNFVVERHFQIENFVPETFYSLENKVKSKNKFNKIVFSTFKWERGNIFDKNFVIYFHSLLKNSTAKISNIKINPKIKYKPLPLRTVEFQKICSSYFRFSSHNLMEIAEKLYIKGYISYPRTETDSFPNNFEHQKILNKLKNDESLGNYCSAFSFKCPRAGKNNDQAHAPIYPLKDGSGLDGEERKIYEFIARRYLGCVSDNAKGEETEYTIEIQMLDRKVDCKASGLEFESFKAKGLVITERNYLDIYFFEKWEEIDVGEFEFNQEIENNLEIKEGKTSKPEYLTESDLINLMDKNGIGTDATIHEHIQKIQMRGYAKKSNNKIIPLQLGINLISAYNAMKLDICEPTLRKNLEENLVKICSGQKSKEEVLQATIEEYKRVYKVFESKINLFKSHIKREKSIVVLDNDDGSDGNDSSDSGELKHQTPKFTNKTEEKKPFDYKNNKENKPHPKIIESGKNIIKSFNMKDYRKNVEGLKNTTKSGYDETFDKETSKIEKNAGKSYISTSASKKLGFFSREENGNKNIGKSKNNFSKPPQNEDIKCYCGFDACKKVANTEANKGRIFFGCNKNYKKCKFFKWADDI